MIETRGTGRERVCHSTFRSQASVPQISSSPDLRGVGSAALGLPILVRIRVVGPGSLLAMPASWLVAMAMAKAMPPREVKALTPQAQHQSLFMQRSALMPDGAAALTAENLFPTRTCDASSPSMAPSRVQR